MKYEVHPSPELNELFRRRPFQGQDPEQSTVLILGNDANYSADISAHDFFRRIVEYHADGLRFWTKHGTHHPFLLPEYPFDKRIGGVRYHSNFAKMEFSPHNAPHFSFVELLHVPTIGNTGSDQELLFRLLDRNHLQWARTLDLLAETELRTRQPDAGQADSAHISAPQCSHAAFCIARRHKA